ncbi:RNA polymerase sigma-70 factor (ECF subfamily) [Macellibacteroides fermentans]|uniref:RNA polymerase sigma-70 factor (ECF subfamily) n=2 Tax=Macellibacteroides fermentans TaxID=879969 RepID=A0A8E1ZW36_9PORP|nr:RNA polymerase sigma-70 factor (ECF subfamily) [Macellibacteroides fermentans]
MNLFLKKYYVCKKEEDLMAAYTSRNTDEELYQLIQKGVEKAFDTFFLRHYPALCSYANQFVEREDAEEIAQEIMIWFWENRTMPVWETSLISYLFKAVKNRCITLINRNDLKQRILQTLYEGDDHLFDDPDFYVVEELSQKIQSALEALPSNYREAFEMNRFQKLTYKEIASQLNVSSKTVDYRIQQALKQLRIDLKDYLPLILFLY